MELPAIVMIFNTVYENLNGQTGNLVSVHKEGQYELQVKFRDRHHTVLIPISSTVLIYQEPILEVQKVDEIER